VLLEEFTDEAIGGRNVGCGRAWDFPTDLSKGQ
jgi:hypothetical protein